MTRFACGSTPRTGKTVGVGVRLGVEVMESGDEVRWLGGRRAPLGSGSGSGKTDGGQNDGGMVGGCWWVVRGGVRSEPGTTVEWVWAVWFFGCLWG